MPDQESYFEAVEIESMDFIGQALEVFFQHYDPDKPTIILLPGGLGSTLKQSFFSFNGFPQPPTAFRRTIWVDMGLLLGSAVRLPIDDQGFDTNDRIVVADGDLDYCLVHPYTEAVRYFRDDLNANVLVMGWDWRRKVMTSVEYLARTLTEMAARALNLSGHDILDTTYLVGHSMGGMVAKLLMTSQPHLASSIKGMISVGSPFYGYFGQLDRFYNGVEYFNLLYGAPDVASITSSWPGMYSLLPIDLATYTHSHQALGLTSYPVVDAVSGAPVDPYNSNSFARYPDWTRTNEIPRGLTVRNALAAPLPGSLGEKVHHLLVDQANSTQVSVSWQPTLPPDYEPGMSPSPVQFQNGKGDGVIPAWSAALASTPHANIHTSDQGSHALLMEEPWVLARIASIINETPIEALAVEKSLVARADIATREEAEAVIHAIHSGKITRSKLARKGGRPAVSPAVSRRLMVEYGL